MERERHKAGLLRPSVHSARGPMTTGPSSAGLGESVCVSACECWGTTALHSTGLGS